MHWIGIGFLIAIGFVLASVALPIIGVIMLLAWEHKGAIAAVIGILGLILYTIIDPEMGGVIIFWLIVIIWFMSGKVKKDKK
jgi:hypothetical protein